MSTVFFLFTISGFNIHFMSSSSFLISKMFFYNAWRCRDWEPALPPGIFSNQKPQPHYLYYNLQNWKESSLTKKLIDDGVLERVLQQKLRRMISQKPFLINEWGPSREEQCLYLEGGADFLHGGAWIQAWNMIANGWSSKAKLKTMLDLFIVEKFNS